jgi:hypothetical protein
MENVYTPPVAEKSPAKSPRRQMLYIRKGDEDIWRRAKALAKREHLSLSTLVVAKLEQVLERAK